MATDNLKDVDSHFAFGQNWSSYAELIGAEQIAQAKEALTKLVPQREFDGRSFIDIGCGSGLHAFAASQLGASRILAVDIDSHSVATAKRVLAGISQTPCEVEQVSVFDLDASRIGKFDIVYSWGVLHHTGSMWEAIEKAAAIVAPNGLLVLAIYRKTHLDPFWKAEKRLYARAPKWIQNGIRAAYVAAFRLALLATGRRFRTYIDTYKSRRGMDFYHDVHDWLGGYPYESATAAQIGEKLTALGFKAERVFARPVEIGIFGSGCDEYTYRKIS